MNNHYNELVGMMVGRWMDNFIEFTFEKHLWLGICLLLFLAYFLIKFYTKPIR